ncbi:Single-stranded DNA-binding protein 3 [Labeo rohita]|uniref:Single-stranded DNA-binding protein 3 n=1 Tax=Labeo rohita TaxID=84645 RepID=A0ABQ8MGE2_LABRO|nr:Single-stranded DNA-binding protein 3 [Labeo rohita]
MSPRFGGGPRPPIRMGNQPPGGVPAAQPMLPNMDPRLQGPMQRMSVPRGMGPMGPQSFGGGMRPPHNSMGPGMPGVNMGPGNGRPPWPNPNANNMPYSSPSPGAYGGPQGGGPPGTPGIVPSPADSNNSSENLYTMINSGGGGRNSFPIGPGSEGPLGAMAGMDPMHMNGGSGDLDGLPKNSPNNMSGMSNPPGTPRDEDVGGSYLHSFQNENTTLTTSLLPFWALNVSFALLTMQAVLSFHDHERLMPVCLLRSGNSQLAIDDIDRVHRPSLIKKKSMVTADIIAGCVYILCRRGIIAVRSRNPTSTSNFSMVYTLNDTLILSDADPDKHTTYETFSELLRRVTGLRVWMGLPAKCSAVVGFDYVMLNL